MEEACTVEEDLDVPEEVVVAAAAAEVEEREVEETDVELESRVLAEEEVLECDGVADVVDFELIVMLVVELACVVTHELDLELVLPCSVDAADVLGFEPLSLVVELVFVVCGALDSELVCSISVDVNDVVVSELGFALVVTLFFVMVNELNLELVLPTSVDVEVDKVEEIVAIILVDTDDCVVDIVWSVSVDPEGLGRMLELDIDDIDDIDALDVLLVSIFWLEVLDVSTVE